MSKAVGDRHADIDRQAGSLERLLELSRRQAAEGQGDAPWPPHYRKQAGEAPRVAPSRRRTPTRPLIEIGRARSKSDALAGLERWKTRHPEAAAHLEPADVLVDAMRGRFRTWTRVRVNLQRVPEELRPRQETLDPDENMEDDWKGVSRGEIAAPNTLRELERSRDLQLVVAAVARRLVGTPALKNRRVAEPIALHVVVLHLAHTFDSERLPRQILARRSSGSARRACASPVLHRPRPPTRARDDCPAHAARNGSSSDASCRRVAIVNDDVTPTWCSRCSIVIKAQQERPHELVPARSCASGIPRPRSRRCARASL